MNPSVNLLGLTGPNSFTGLWIAREFARAGWNVHGLLHDKHESYRDLKKLRTDELAKVATLHEEICAETPAMENWIRKFRPSIWVHHHHFMDNYRSPAYDLERAREVAVRPLRQLVTTLSESGCRGVIFSGSFFEPGEGGRGPDNPATPYGVSKAETWQVLKLECDRIGLLASRVVIPNPVGPYENSDRLIPVLLERARAGSSFTIQGPEASSDYLPAESLAGVYLKTARELLAGTASVHRPSGKRATLRSWVHEVCDELITTRLQAVEPKIEEISGTSKSFSLENPANENLPVDWKRFWDDYAETLRLAGWNTATKSFR